MEIEDFKTTKNIPAVQTLIISKAIMEIFNIYHSPIIPNSYTTFMTLQDEVKLYLQVAKVDGEFILKIEDFKTTPCNKGVGSLIMYILSRASELCDCKLGLWTTPQNTVAEKWYKKLGFVAKETLEHNNHTWWEKDSEVKVYDYYDNKFRRNNILELDVIDLLIHKFYVDLMN